MKKKIIIRAERSINFTDICFTLKIFIIVFGSNACNYLLNWLGLVFKIRQIIKFILQFCWLIQCLGLFENYFIYYPPLKYTFDLFIWIVSTKIQFLFSRSIWSNQQQCLHYSVHFIFQFHKHFLSSTLFDCSTFENCITIPTRCGLVL